MSLFTVMPRWKCIENEIKSFYVCNLAQKNVAMIKVRINPTFVSVPHVTSTLSCGCSSRPLKKDAQAL
jgi:hypothetical protein